MRAGSTPFLSVVIPVYNEESRIGQTLEGILAYLKNRCFFEVVVVDNGSGDRTVSLVNGYAQRHPEVRLICQPGPLGKGAAVRRGVLEAQGERILFSDADLSAPIVEVEKLLSAIESGADVAIASRALPGSEILIPQPWRRRMAGWAFRWVTKAFFQLPFADTQCGFKCFKRQAALEIFSRSRIDGFAFDVEALLLAKRLGFLVAEIPVQWADNPESKVHLKKQIFETGSDLGRIFIRLRLQREELSATHPRAECSKADGGGNGHEGLDAPSMPALHVKETLREGNG